MRYPDDPLAVLVQHPALPLTTCAALLFLIALYLFQLQYSSRLWIRELLATAAVHATVPAKLSYGTPTPSKHIEGDAAYEVTRPTAVFPRPALVRLASSGARNRRPDQARNSS